MKVSKSKANASPPPSADKRLHPLSFLALSLFTLGLVTACQTAPKKYSEVNEGTWSGRALIKDKVKHKSNVVNIKFNAIKDQNLRLDVTTTTDMHLASLVVNGPQVEFILVREKKYYKGPSSDRALRPLFSLPLNPQYLHSLLFDTAIADKNWVCTNDAKGYIQSCKHLQSALEIQWENRKGSFKTVNLVHPQAEVQMNFNSFNPSLEKKDQLFQLKVPKSFSSFRL